MRFIVLLLAAIGCNAGDDTIHIDSGNDDEDLECPEFQHIPVASPQTIGLPVSVTATITDDSGVRNGGAVLYFKRETAIAWEDDSNPVHADGSTSYEFTIPGEEVDGAAGMHYYIWAQDSSPLLNECTLPNDGEEGPYHFTIDAAEEKKD